MNNGFEERIKKIEHELTNIKTASDYSSIKSANFTSSYKVTTGLYQINYAQGRTGVFSFVYCGDTGYGSGIAYPRTPNGFIQIVEIDTDRSSEGQTVTDEANLIIVSNTPVISISRL